MSFFSKTSNWQQKMGKIRHWIHTDSSNSSSRPCVVLKDWLTSLNNTLFLLFQTNPWSGNHAASWLLTPLCEVSYSLRMTSDFCGAGGCAIFFCFYHLALPYLVPGACTPGSTLLVVASGIHGEFAVGVMYQSIGIYTPTCWVECIGPKMNLVAMWLWESSHEFAVR